MREIAYKDAQQHFGPFFSPFIRFKGVWDMQDLYEFLAHYFRERKYDFSEKNYKHKRPSPFGVERQYVMEGIKLHDDIYKFIVTIYIHTYDAHDIDVKLPDGSIKTFTRGRIWIQVSGKIEKYYDDRWNEHPLWGNLRIFLNAYIMKKKHGEDLWDIMMYGEMQKLVWLIRRRLKMEYDEYEQKYWNGVHR